MLTSRRSLRLLGPGLLLVLLAPFRLFAGDVVVLSKENGVYRRVLKGYIDEARAEPEVVVLPEDEAGRPALRDTLRRKNPAVLVAVGDEAARWALGEWRGSPVVLAGVIRSQIPAADLARARAVTLDIPLTTQLKILRDYLPQVRLLGIFYSAPENRAPVEALVAAAPGAGVSVWAETVTENRDFVRALHKIESQVNAFLLIFDPLLLSPEAFEYLVNFSLARQIPLVVPAAALLKSGGTLSVEADYEGVGRQAAGLAREARTGAPPRPGGTVAPPASWRVGLNLKMVRRLGLAVAPELLEKVDYVYE